ncbi:membrane-associated protein, putative [Bodo saltans]|uniref:Membrane-associated protein, putative n=1 Tax=Bodo saltans TaxID=75058 RepID=A0A0S4JV78_BODSA|nr:membrane-associated protein, putative [Bodo saltans]|eukprot:CUG94125.1 membrane-associated protein, putative [Bodo saltans]
MSQLTTAAAAASTQQTLDPFLGPATTFLTTVPVPPIWLLLLASLSGCLLNGLLNYFLARASDVALLSSRIDNNSKGGGGSEFASPLQQQTQAQNAQFQNQQHQDLLGVSFHNMSNDGNVQNSSFNRYGSIGSTPNNADLGLKASRAYERHVAFAAAARRHWRKRHPTNNDDDEVGEHTPLNPFMESDAIVTNDQLHFPASPAMLSGAYGSFEDNSEALAILKAKAAAAVAPTVAPGPTPVAQGPPQIFVTPTTTLAQSFAMAGGTAPPVGVEAVVAAANLQSTLREIRLEAQYVVFDTNRFFLISSTFKCLLMVVYLHYSLDIPGGWKRFTVATGMSLICGLLTPLVELLCALLLPSDSEVEDARRRQARQEEADKEKADTVLLVELVLRYCTYDFKDLTTVFIQNAVFVLLGTIFVPPLVGFCFTQFFAYLWVFLLPVMVLYYTRRQYYREAMKKNRTASEEDSSSSGGQQRSVRVQGLLELLKCVLLKTFIIFLCLWTMQATFVLAMATKEGRSYWDSLSLLWEIQFAKGMGAYFHEIRNQSSFWRIAVVSQLLL